MVAALVLLAVVIQNRAKTTVDLLLWTVSVRLGAGLALMFLAGWLCGSVTGFFYRKQRLVPSGTGTAHTPLPYA
jgi:uncharacterized integral membrane protein